MGSRLFILLFGGAILFTAMAATGLPLLVLLAASPTVATPPLLQDLPAMLPESETAFEGRLAEAFPRGSSENALITRLRAEGFGRSPADLSGPDPSKEHLASFVLPGSGCAVTWRVRWRAEAGRIVSVSGVYDATCL
jgi:hypothetical protein